MAEDSPTWRMIFAHSGESRRPASCFRSSIPAGPPAIPAGRGARGVPAGRPAPSGRLPRGCGHRCNPRGARGAGSPRRPASTQWPVGARLRTSSSKPGGVSASATARTRASTLRHATSARFRWSVASTAASPCTPTRSVVRVVFTLRQSATGLPASKTYCSTSKARIVGVCRSACSSQRLHRVHAGDRPDQRRSWCVKRLTSASSQRLCAGEPHPPSV